VWVVKVHRLISSVAKKMSLPNWWVEAIAIEYTDCRDFATRDEIWTFNFDKVTQKSLEEAIRSYKVAMRDPIFHNVNSAVIGHRTLRNLFGGIPTPLCKDITDLIAEGPMSNYNFLFKVNSIDVWDPKLDFPSHFQVLDEGQIWQWHTRENIPNIDTGDSKYVSSKINNEIIEKIRTHLADLRNPVIKPGEKLHGGFKKKVERFYRWLDDVRRPILIDLWEVHCKNKRQCNHSKVTNIVPPLLSHFETFTVDQGTMSTMLSAAPIFFRSTIEHALEAEKLTSSTKGPMEVVDKLDKIYQERASAIVFASSCLEAFINGLYSEHFPRIWKDVERIPLTTKWKLFFELKGKGDTFEVSRQPFQTLVQLVHSRNSLVHYKNSFQKVKISNDRVITHTEETDLPREMVSNLLQRLPELIENLCLAADIMVPAWIYPHQEVGWCTSLNTNKRKLMRQ